MNHFQSFPKIRDNQKQFLPATRQPDSDLDKQTTIFSRKASKPKLSIIPSPKVDD
jgi:hypothetical protein